MRSAIKLPDQRRHTLTVKLSGEEMAALRHLATVERLPLAQVVRRLIWRAARTRAGAEPQTVRQ
jgi:hypothetical protein